MPISVLLFDIYKWSGLTLIAAFAAIVIWKLASGDIPLNGLLEGSDASGRRFFSPARVQLLIFTVFVAVKYVFEVVNSPDRDALPRLPTETLALLGGSQAIYALGKAISTLLPGLRKLKLN